MRIRAGSPYRFQTTLVSVAAGILVANCGLAQETSSGTEADVRVECVSPDGQLSDISKGHYNEGQIASIVDRATISCALPEGVTTFIIAVPKNGLPDRFTFLNENLSARGELKIAVANSPLPANSSKWVEVDGIVPFAHKRLFNLSMLGIDTKYVRLSFRVEKEGDSSKSAQVSVSANTFRTSALSAAINSKFARLHLEQSELNLASISVESLSYPSAK